MVLVRLSPFFLKPSFLQVQILLYMISHRGGTKKIIETAKIVQLKDAHIISMTAFHTNELTTYANNTLFCFSDSYDTKRDDSKSRTGFFILVDLLINELESLL